MGGGAILVLTEIKRNSTTYRNMVSLGAILEYLLVTATQLLIKGCRRIADLNENLNLIDLDARVIVYSRISLMANQRRPYLVSF